ncbi:TetR/AcrR family transcriptional regulator [Actinoplanes xinjiangensis]|uniref:TetR family transcriptional regulator n=1 Tax=Actinoplanes xinjiangensis TaxID=512350 RepID=A0A316FHG1_9ACTN|nr:TetR/AcrR family transcriptional regulator C-terminal domain-containing protein [Actinoplanes xinjiangensis]PWK47565.1 TetR family transcriptional regulator [Actinoplanes xinjiangensis]GIF39508.1 TetR family transcriptional regulator [Actinoplanes xinjiangensis]
MTSIWLRTEPDRPRRSPQLTRERIVAAAVELLDGSGVETLTMRRLAERLAVTSTALYWHVRSKDDVLDLAVDEVFGEVPLPGPTADWAADVRTLVHGWRAAMLAHPWTPALIGRPLIGPNVLARTEFLQAALVRGGLTGEDLAVTTRLIANFVIGAAVTEATRQPDGDGARLRITADPGAYPHLVGSGHLDTSRWPDDLLFTRGLDAILAAAG